jgi:hypothetical protein
MSASTINIADIEAFLDSVAKRAGVPCHHVELSFSRTSKDGPLWPDVTVYMGVLPGLGKGANRALGSGETIEAAADAAIQQMDMWRKLSADEVAAKRRRKSLRKVTS